jgi:type IV secretion system coupling TraD/TrwB family protein
MQPHETPIPPLSPLLSLGGELASLLAHLGVGVALGAGAVAFMRRRHLRWTWTLPALALELPAHTLLGRGSSLTLLAATVCAAVRGRRRHREDLAWGGDLRELAEARTGPLRFARTRLVALRERCGSAAVAQRALAGGRMAVGRDEYARPASIAFGAGSGRHTLVVGATGSGKTVTQTWILCTAIRAGLAAVVLDPKGDRHLREQLAASARECGRELLEWTPTGPCVYNPFGHGSASEVADRALAGERFTEPHYQRQAQRYLGYAVRALRGAGMAVSLAALVDLLDPERLEQVASLLSEQQTTATIRYLDGLGARQRTDLGGVRDRLAILAESDVGEWLDPSRPDAVAFDLLSAMRRRAVVYFALRSDSWPLLAQMLGVAIVGDLRCAMAALQRAPVPSVVAIDEFAAVAAEQIVHLFSRARSAGINLLLGTQELSDLRAESRPQLRDQVLGNLASLIAHRQVVCESAELLSRLAGTRGVWRTSQTGSGGWARSRASAPLLAPERIRTLPVGEAAVLDLARGEAVLARVFSGRSR